jgi:hypothetical protein
LLQLQTTYIWVAFCVLWPEARGASLAHTHKDTGEVTSVVTMSLDGGCPEDGGSVGDSIARDITDIAQDDWTSYSGTKYWDNGWVTRGDKPSSNHIWQDGEWVFSTAHFSFQVRMQRLALLNQSDWMGICANKIIPGYDLSGHLIGKGMILLGGTRGGP